MCGCVTFKLVEGIEQLIMECLCLAGYFSYSQAGRLVSKIKSAWERG